MLLGWTAPLQSCCPVHHENRGTRLEVATIQHEGSALLGAPLVGARREGRQQPRQPVAHLARGDGPLQVALAVPALRMNVVA